MHSKNRLKPTHIEHPGLDLLATFSVNLFPQEYVTYTAGRGQKGGVGGRSNKKR